MNSRRALISPPKAQDRVIVAVQMRVVKGCPIGGLAAIKAVHDLLRTMTKSLPSHGDLMLILSVEGQPNVDLQHLIAAD
jgi:hypothetical protein